MEKKPTKESEGITRYLESLRKVNKVKLAAVLAAMVSGGVMTSQEAKLFQFEGKKPDITVTEAVRFSKILTPTLSQRDNFTMPHRTCNSTSNAMYLNFYRALIGKNVVTDDTYLASVLRRGDTIYHDVQTRTLKAYGLDTVWFDDGNLSRVKATLQSGQPVVVNILHRGSVRQGTLRGGHIIILRGYDAQKKVFHVSDPYGLLESNYKETGSFSYEMKEDIFDARWQGGYRLASKDQATKFNLERF